MGRHPRVLTTEEMLSVMWLGQLLLDWEAMPQRYVMGMRL